MAELTQRERLQPSLLDRLTDDDPQDKVESRERRTLSPAQLRNCIKRDLSWLLNTAHMASVRDLDEYPEIARTVLNFGVVDLTGKTVSSVVPQELERLIRQAIWDFEPRLLRHSVKVTVLEKSESMGQNALAFSIEALLWAQPMPLQLYLRTEIDLEDGSVDVVETGRS
jgi:type VI secretion system protein ImpF